MVTQNSWNAPNPSLDGYLLIGKTSTGHPVVNTLTPGTGIDVANGSGSITISTNLSAFPNQNNIIYVSKAGNDLNSGLNIENAVLTFGQAIVLANAAVPSSTNRFTILCFDDGIYSENIVLPSYVDLCACNAELDGTIDLNDSQSIKFRAQHVATGLTGITQNSGKTSNICVNAVTCDGSANWIVNTSGTLNILWDEISITDGTGIYANGGACLIQGGIILIYGTGVGLSADNASTLAGGLSAIADQVTGASYAIYVRDESFVTLTLQADIQCDTAILVYNPTPAGPAIVSITCGAIQAATAYNVTFGTLSLICNNIIGGTRLTSGTGVANVTVANPYGTAGQIWQSNGNGVDPSWSNDTSIQQINGDTGSATGSTITLTANQSAGTTVAFSGSGSTVTLETTDTNDNVVIGARYLGSPTISGSGNVGLGWASLNAVTSGSDNCCLGYTAGTSLLDGGANTGIGAESLNSLTSGSDNTAVGLSSGAFLTTGNRNILLGRDSGQNYTSSESSNIIISNDGMATESNVIRIGTEGVGVGTQNACYVAGINGVTTSNSNFVTIDTTTGQLGATSVAGGTLWQTITSSQTATPGNGYICNGGSLITLTLPATCPANTVIRLTNRGAGGWLVNYGTGQSIRFGSSVTTTTTGSLASTTYGDSIELLCVVANTTWYVLSSIGDITVV